MTFIIGIFQFHCKQVKQNKIKQDMCKFDSILSHLQGTTLFK